jgi:hypothetical protein
MTDSTKDLMMAIYFVMAIGLVKCLAIMIEKGWVIMIEKEMVKVKAIKID